MYFKPQNKVGLYDSQFEKDNCGLGFVANIEGHQSRTIVTDALTVLENMDHRGARGAERNTGDGAGISTGMPLFFLKKILKVNFDIEATDPDLYATGIIFLPREQKEKEYCKKKIEQQCNEYNLKYLGWRKVPLDIKGANLGDSAISAMPDIEQLLIHNSQGIKQEEFEQKLYLIRKNTSNQLRMSQQLKQADLFYICSLSSKIIVYKGMLTCDQLSRFYLDLQDQDYQSHFGMVHSRFSTNTFPSWDRAMPNRLISHNGEINTIKGNNNWMKAREGNISSKIFGENTSDLFPIIEPNCSDSGNFDNALEFLYMNGRSIEESILMMIPEAWQKKKTLSDERKAYYEFQSTLMEPWDGPACITFTNGDVIGSILDRNGLRPSRYYITKDNKVIMASEVGVLPVPDNDILVKGRLEPGKIFLIDFKKGTVLSDNEVKDPLIEKHPYRDWLVHNRLIFRNIKTSRVPVRYSQEELLQRMRAFGYTSETLEFILLPMVHDLRDPLGSMGNDSALAVLSDKPRLLFDYFKQLFAQVSNPAIDSIREKIIMSLECYIGPEKNLVDATQEHAARLLVENPILTDTALAAIKHLDHVGQRTKTIDITFDISKDSNEPFQRTIKQICSEVEDAVDQGFSFVVLTDRKIDRNRASIPMLMACGAVHHHLVKTAKRTQIGIVIESAEAREVHHFCLLFGYGADAINPYLTYGALLQARDDGLIGHSHHHRGPENRIPLTDDIDLIDAYRQAAVKGILKVMGKMGISTLQSYKGAQIFEAVGLANNVIELCFNGTASRVEGSGFNILKDEAIRRHSLGFPNNKTISSLSLPNPGEYHWRSEGEKKAWNPEAVWSLQYAARTNDKSAYKKFARIANAQAEESLSLRGLLSFKKIASDQHIDLSEVEPASSIVKRFNTGAMSFGSISSEAHETLAIAMNRIGGKSNSGEGGEDPNRFKPLSNGDSKSSAIKQIASGRFGVTASYIASAKQLQIKIAQGAKPGEGGELPGRKVDEKIASIRYSTPGVGLISPPPHHDIYSIEDLSQLIFDLKNANRSAEGSVKLVSEVGIGTIAAGVVKAHADHIVVSGDVGGTGASPLTSIKNAGLPWELGVAEVHQTLVLNNLRSRVKIQTDGGLKTGRDIIIAALLGAEEMGFSTAPLITMGCIMMRKCHLNTCPVGIATQDKILREKFTGQPEHVINYLFMVAEEAREIMSTLGVKTFDELVGRVDLLVSNTAINHWKGSHLDLSLLLQKATDLRPNTGVVKSMEQDHDIKNVLDRHLIKSSKASIKSKDKIEISLPINNLNRATGAMLSHEVVKAWGEEALPNDTINVHFEGSAGQSFGAFLSKGISFTLSGDSNDYVGKGLSGGKIIVKPPKGSSFKAENNIIIGNVAMYGATSGIGFFRGKAAERFCVRNSGARAVVEGVGDHACEYMTGGRVVILGPTGVNFGAGMSGGIAYIYDPDSSFESNCNTGMVELEMVDDKESIAELLRLIELHHRYTSSENAENILNEWPSVLSDFVKVMPTDYKRVLQERTEHNEEIESIFDIEDRKSKRRGN